MPLSGAKAVSFAVLLILSQCAESLIIPEELPTLLSVVYSNIPPIKKGTDSRIGVGFRLGEHADFQVLLEYGPQRETGAIGNTSDTKRKRAVLMAAALKGEMGPFAQAVAKYQMELKIKKLLEKYKIKPEAASKTKVDASPNADNKSEASDWLSKWSQGVEGSSDDPFLIDTSSRKVAPTVNRMKVVSSQTSGDQKSEDAQKDLVILKKLFGGGSNDETKSA